MLNKKAIELSMNFIVILIISIVIFGFGVSFISRLSSQATELQEITIGELDERIDNLVCEGSDRVCIGRDRKTIKRAKFDVFGLKIINVLNSQNLDVVISPSVNNPLDVLGYKKDKTEIRVSDNAVPLIVNPPSRSIFIEKNEEKLLGIGVQVPANAVSGTYILNARIQTADGQQYSQVQKLYVDVP